MIKVVIIKPPKTKYLLQTEKLSGLIRPNKNIVSQALSHLFQMPLICLFRLVLNTVASFILFICQNQNIKIVILKMNKKGVSLVFDEIKIKKVASSISGEIKNKNKNLPASSVFQKGGLRNTCLFFSLRV